MMRLLIACIAVSCLLLSGNASAAHPWRDCAACLRHGGDNSDPAAGRNRANGCTPSHQGYETIFDHAMALRSSEMQFVQRSYARVDSSFWDKNCTSCHLTGCLDCHDRGLAPPSVASCQRCHNGYYTGWDYSGRAPREDNMRYQRGIAVNGQTFLKMLPDVHYRAGMGCGACHSMASLAAGRKSSKGCRDCHRPNLNVVEHRITAHLERLECYACHSSWAPQEYGTFFLRFRDRQFKEDFDLRSGPNAEYLRSAYLKRQDAPPLGRNAAGRVSPIRPMFIAYYTDIMSARNNGPENVLLAAEWRAWFPHTVQRGSVTCEGCHDTPSRFLLEPAAQRIYDLEKDGLGLTSFWLQQGQQLRNGSFISPAEYQQFSRKTPAYTKAYLEKWQTFLTHGAASSKQ